MTGEVWRLPRADEGYPVALHDLDEPPAALHGIGDAGLVRGIGRDAAVTVVGSRHPSSYGLEVAEELGYLLAAAGLVVVSGMALGIDAAAHRGAVDAGGSTVAVLGSGPDVVYPRSERRLYERIVSTGAVVSEMPPGTAPGPGCFPRRNRIMAALGTMTVVVEAAQPSGSLITAEQAARLGREVGAVPGRVTSRVARGTNALLAEGAAVIRDAQDVLDRMLGVWERGPRIATAPRWTRTSPVSSERWRTGRRARTRPPPRSASRLRMRRSAWPAWSCSDTCERTQRGVTGGRRCVPRGSLRSSRDSR